MAKRSGIMLCYPLEERRLPGTGWVNAWDSWPVLVQPKLDGERARSVFDLLGPPWLVSSEQNRFTAIPHINQAIQDQGHEFRELDGELYVHGMDFPTIHSIVSRTQNLHPEYAQMQYHVFDIISDLPQFARIKELGDLYLKPPLFRVHTYLASSFDELMEHYDMILDQGYEGIIIRKIDGAYVRKRSMEIMKFKPKKSDYYEISGYEVEISIHGERKNRLGSLRCYGRDLTPFNVGSGFTDAQRHALWQSKEDLIGKLVHVQYQQVNSSGAPRFPVFIELIEARGTSERNFLLDL